MTTHEAGERRLLWERSGSQCAICHGDVVPRGSAGPRDLPGIEMAIESQDETTEPLDYDDVVLVCIGDAMSVQKNSAAFSPTRLRELKSTIELIEEDRLLRHQTGAAHQVRMLCHIAYFENNHQPLIFIKIANDSMTIPVIVNRVWFNTNPEVPVQNPSRNLPAKILPRQLFETWIPARYLPATKQVFELARAELSDGSIINSERNVNVSPAGAVGGAGIPLDEINVNEGILNSSAPDTWDAFISHASADKDHVARPLKDALEARGIRVWFDETTLRIGDSLRRSIDNGLQRSAMGIIILSPAFFESGWSNFELDGIVVLTQSGRQSLLPVWHSVTAEQVLNFSPSLADKVGRNTAKTSIDDIAEEIAQLIRSKKA